ncbi:hypothetical protein N9242_05160 [Vicingaceae bacterium]|nr:hypothetical protein [Vicingaceae bacterium]
MKTAKLTELSNLIAKFSTALTNKSAKEIEEAKLLPADKNYRTEMSLNLHLSIMDGFVYELERDILDLVDTVIEDEKKDFVIDLYFHVDSLKKVKNAVDQEKMKFGKVSEGDILDTSIWQNISVRYDTAFSMIEALGKKIIEFENSSCDTQHENFDEISSSINKIRVNMPQYDLALLAQILRRMEVFSDYINKPYDKTFFKVIESLFMCKNDKGPGYRQINNFKDTISKPARNDFDKNKGKQSLYWKQVDEAIENLRIELKAQFKDTI